MVISNKNFLWVTRGYTWGSRYLSECANLDRSVVHKVYVEVFQHDVTRLGHWDGSISIGGVHHVYVASRCEHHGLGDEFRRPITHELLILCSESEKTALMGRLWEKEVFDSIKPLYEKVFAATSPPQVPIQVDFCLKTGDAAQIPDGKTPSAKTDTERPATKHTPLLKVVCVVLLLIGFLVLFKYRTPSTNTASPVLSVWFDEKKQPLVTLFYESSNHAIPSLDTDKIRECFVAGFVPTNADELFRAVISISNGRPQISWEPQLSAENEAKRTYAVEGRESLTSGSWGPTNAASRFFRVKVTLP